MFRVDLSVHPVREFFVSQHRKDGSWPVPRPNSEASSLIVEPFRETFLLVPDTIEIEEEDWMD